MDPTHVLILAFWIGAISGLRSLTAPAAVAWAAHRNWLNLQGTPLSFMGSPALWLFSPINFPPPPAA